MSVPDSYRACRVDADCVDIPRPCGCPGDGPLAVVNARFAEDPALIESLGLGRSAPAGCPEVVCPPARGFPFSAACVAGRCGSVQGKPAPAVAAAPAVSEVLYETGRGDGPYDKMTYGSYESRAEFQPTGDMVVVQMRPDVTYCNGTCFVEARILDRAGRLLADGKWTDDGDNRQFEGVPLTLDRPVRLKAGVWYGIYLHAWTTKSVEVYTAGTKNEFRPGGRLKTKYARSAGNNHIRRGMIGFKLLGSR